MINIEKSKLRTNLFKYFFSRPDRILYIREIARAIKADPSNLLRELNRLEQLGIFASEVKGRQKYYKLNKHYPLYNELKSIVAKTVGIESKLLKIIKGLVGIKCAFIYGSYAGGKERADSDIDLFIIGNINIDILLEKISGLENNIGREINYRIYSESDFKTAIKNKNSFILNIIKNKKIYLKGDEKYFKKFIG